MFTYNPQLLHGSLDPYTSQSDIHSLNSAAGTAPRPRITQRTNRGFAQDLAHTYRRQTYPASLTAQTAVQWTFQEDLSRF